ncbi:MAG TPA: tRNA (adenosine(37)-N6)-threonylcarbamoyltransferase complex transferase subunit TsaD [Armatimonadota bacterium]|nr:tRNA (adenosine(37)-N6)-threonylcarbamoyltransferase complex transferase subunit TsaD [Armatimonadota bacterium]
MANAPIPIENTLVLGIESSCDETAAAVIKGGTVIASSVVASQEELHARFGGIVPEVASRKHVQLMPAVVDQALMTARAKWSDLTAIAVTNGPGLVGSLIVGVAAAKAYSMTSGVPLIGVNHIDAHVHAVFLHQHGERSAFDASGAHFPIVCLVASGGHCDLLHVEARGEYRLLGCALDDAPGEAFDKAARLLDLGYPGGPAVERAAASASGASSTVDLPRPDVRGSLDFSFSGLKSALVRTMEHRDEDHAVVDIAHEFQSAVAETLVRNTMRAVETVGAKGVTLGGGVAANSHLRELMAAEAGERGVPCAVAPRALCTDNAAMVAAAGAYAILRQGPDDLSLDVFSTLQVANHE